MNENVFSRNLSYEECINIFFITIIFGISGTFMSVFTGSFILFFTAIIPGILIDILKFAAKVYLLNHKIDGTKKQTKAND